MGDLAPNSWDVHLASGRLTCRCSNHEYFVISDHRLGGIYSLTGEGDVYAALNLGPVTMDVSDTWLLRPQIKAEYFLTRKITVRVSGDYVRTRPDIGVSDHETVGCQ